MRAMWICASCGTEARQPEVCSGCGAVMKPFGEPPKENKFQLVLIAHLLRGGIELFGPFANVMEADQWWDKHTASSTKYGWKDYEVVLMENPDGLQGT